MWARQSGSATLIIGPILDASGVEDASAVIGDLSISKNGGALTALAAAATLTYIANGQYTLVMTTTNLNTLGRLQITCNKATYQMPSAWLMVVPAHVYDGLVLGTDNLQVDAIQFAGQVITAAAGVTIPTSIASPTNITAATGVDVSSGSRALIAAATISALGSGTEVFGHSYLESIKRIEVTSGAATLSGAGTGTEVMTSSDSSKTATFTVDAFGNVSAVDWT